MAHGSGRCCDLRTRLFAELLGGNPQSGVALVELGRMVGLDMSALKRVRLRSQLTHRRSEGVKVHHDRGLCDDAGPHKAEPLGEVSFAAQKRSLWGNSGSR